MSQRSIAFQSSTVDTMAFNPDKSSKSLPRRKRAPAERHALTRSLLDKARQARKNSLDCQFAIDNPRGTLIRVRNGEISYFVQARSPTDVVKRKICSVDDITFAEIKAIATDALNAIKNGRDVDVVIDAKLKKKNKEQIEVALDQAEASAQELWKLGATIDEYTERTVTRNGETRPRLSPMSKREIKDRLRNCPEAQALMNCYVKELRLQDMEHVKEQIDSSQRGDSAGAKFYRLSKRILRWAARHRRKRTGLDPSEPWWEALVDEYSPGDRSARFLTPQQIGMLLALLEAVRNLEDKTNPAVSGAMQIVTMIVHRSEDLVSMKALGSSRWVDDPAPDRKGWQVYTWQAEEVKAKRAIKLSMPPEVIAIFEHVAREAVKITGVPSQWAFPQIRKKYTKRAYAVANRQSPDNLDKHITASSLNHAWDALAGRKKGWPNLFAIVGLPARAGPHDCRRSLSTYFENQGLGAYASALLDHKVSGVDKMDRAVATITQAVYAAADRVIVKSEGIQLWLDAILPAYNEAKKDSRLQKAIEARKLSLQENKTAGLQKRAQTLAAKKKVPMRLADNQLEDIESQVDIDKPPIGFDL